MTPEPSISRHLERQTVTPMESTIPGDMTVTQWRALLAARRRPAKRRSTRALAAARRVVALRPAPCEHLHEQTTRYNHDAKELSFLLVCPVCRTEKVIETHPYEPRFQPHDANEAAGATVHQLPIRRHEEPERRAA
jgi:hypothetical protein